MVMNANGQKLWLPPGTNATPSKSVARAAWIPIANVSPRYQRPWCQAPRHVGQQKTSVALFLYVPHTGPRLGQNICQECLDRFVRDGVPCALDEETPLS